MAFWGKERCGFSSGRGCVDQLFAVRQLCEKLKKSCEKGKNLFSAFMDLKKACNMVDKDTLW